MGEWTKYYQAVGETPNQQVVRALQKYTGARRAALDLGAGNLRDAKFLLKSGFKSVTAVDKEPQLEQVPGVEFIQRPLENYMPMPNTFDVGISCNTLFFVPRDDTPKILTRSYNALTEGGIFICNLLGSEDSWLTRPEIGAVGYTEEEVRAMLANFSIEDLSYATGHRPTSAGKSAAWAMWRIIIRKE